MSRAFDIAIAEVIEELSTFLRRYGRELSDSDRALLEAAVRRCEQMRDAV